VAERAAEGYEQIAEQFLLSEHTVKNYLSRVFEKLGSPTGSNCFFYCSRKAMACRAESWDQQSQSPDRGIHIEEPDQLRLGSNSYRYWASLFATPPN
jgi:hypothetical protein